MSKLFCLILVGLLSCGQVGLAAGFPSWPANTKSGISVTLTGLANKDWAIEQCYADPVIGDQILYIKSAVQISLAHNERNAIMLETPKIPAVIGVNGADGQPGTGDEGDLYYKIDRDLQAHEYAGSLPEYAVRYAKPFSFDDLTYDGTRTVLGSVGDNGGEWGVIPSKTSKRFAYGQADAAGNEWHTLTFWDNDLPLYKKAKISPHRQGASDGYCLWICVNPKTPVIQLAADGADEYYTTPPKTYFVPKIWPQTTYLTGGVRLNFVNMNNDEPVFYRVDGGTFKKFEGQALVAGSVFSRSGAESVLEVKCGEKGAVLRRSVVLNPDYPALSEKHGYLLWPDEAARQAVIQKLRTVEPFKTAYTMFKNSYYQRTNSTFTATRGQWRATASSASSALANAFVVAIEGAAQAPSTLNLAKNHLLHIARLESVGFELYVSAPSPAKDYLNELGQTMVNFADAGVAYDLLAAYARADKVQGGGMTPIEEILIRDSLAKIAKAMLQFRDNNSAISGAGDTHWAHGYEQAMGIIALAMPTYQSPYFGVSGGDRETANTLRDADGKFWNPFPDQGVTWYQAATDPDIPSPGFPNNRYPFRANFLITDDGWWSGPNDLIGDSDRYFTGPYNRTLVDVKHGGLANAECRVELVEEGGYEAPFIDHSTAFDYMRRIKGDKRRSVPMTNYIRRRLLNGTFRLRWDEATKAHYSVPPRIDSSLLAFNPVFEFAALPAPREAVTQYLNDVSAFFQRKVDLAKRKELENSCKRLYSAYALALCADPATMPAAPSGQPNHPPVIRPLFKAVIRPGETFLKDIIACDLDGDAITVNVEGLPEGATYDSAIRRIVWTPDITTAAVHRVTVVADDGKMQTRRPFFMIVKPDAGQKARMKDAPAGLTVACAADGEGVELRWPAAPTGTGVSYVSIYRDGILWAAVPAGTTSYTDREWIYASTHTRYHIAYVYSSGAESAAISSKPGIFSNGRQPVVTD